MIVKQPEINRKKPDKGLFKKRVVHTKFDIYVFYDHWVDTSGGGLLVSEGIIRPVVSVLALTWFIRYIFIENFSS